MEEFELFLKGDKVGTLGFTEESWTFKYSRWFKGQSSLKTIHEFPDKEQEYSSKKLWPFFASRIPSKINRKGNPDKDDIVYLLAEFGERTINNPFVLKRKR